MKKLNRDTYPTVKAMLESPDPESVVLGLSCIEQSTFKPNVMYIGLLFLECNVRPELWKVHAPETTRLLRTIGLDILDPPTTFKKLLEKVLRYTQDIDDLRLFFNAYSLYLKNRLNKKLSSTDIIIEEITITIKTKDDENRTAVQGSEGSDLD